LSETGRRIPRTMASQHPDHTSAPPWSGDPLIAGDDEVVEVYWAYAQYGTEEVMWDAEGKDIDPYVVRKLLTSYSDFFRERVLGRDAFLTFRLPNPSIEPERKLFLETLQSIPRHNDVARAFYGPSAGPAVFEVILPFTTSHIELVRVRESYRKGVVEPLMAPIDYRGTRLIDWVGELEPEEVEVIPLVEDIDSFLRLEEILLKYIEVVGPKYLRVFLARSDPAMNYGLVTSVLMAKLGLYICWSVGESTGVPVYPIIGTGSLPFRGHNTPERVDRFVEEYRGAYTVTVQSAFRYDWDLHRARAGVAELNSKLPGGRPVHVDPELLAAMTSKLVPKYQEMVEVAADAINFVASFVPPRRMRRQHVGLFGYSRRVAGKRLPRAIPFTAALYSLGTPPELMGLRAVRELKEEEFDLLRTAYSHLDDDLGYAGRRVSMEVINLILEQREDAKRVLGPEFVESFIPFYLEDIATAEEVFGVKVGPRSLSDRRYLNSVENVMISLLSGEDPTEEITRAAVLRRSLG
jgi:phosphoenolpyruvate carboxylase